MRASEKTIHLHVTRQYSGASQATTSRRAGPIWIDLDNTPHVPFFRPIIRELENRGHEVLVTARDAFQVWELAREMGLNCRKVGQHYGKNSALKIFGLVLRALQLFPMVLRNRPKLAVSHGARSQLLLANLIGIPTVGLDDYEHSKCAPFTRARWLLIPEAIPVRTVSSFSDRVRHYSGIKEDVYAAAFRPDSSILRQLRLDPAHIIVTVRPPATEAHYHNPESELFFERFMERVCTNAELRVVLLPRNKKQALDLQKRWPKWFEGGKVVVPEVAVDGLNLLWHSDLAVSGGGTMNREAAALGVPVYSLFRGKIGAVDRQLANEGKLVLIQSINDVDQRIRIERRPKDQVPNFASRRALPDIIGHLENILKECKGD